MRAATWWKATKAGGAVALLALAGVGAVGSWRYVDAWRHPAPAKPPELGRDAGAPTAPADVATQAEQLTREQLLEKAREFGLELRNSSHERSSGTGHAVASPAGDGDAAGGFVDGSIAGALTYPVSLATVDFGPGPRGDTGQAWCYVPDLGAAAQIRFRWTSPPATIAEQAGCAAAEGAAAVDEGVQAAKAAADALAARLGHELALSLRGGPGYGLGGPGLLGLASLSWRTRGGHVGAVDGVAWISSKPAVAAAATFGIDKKLIGKR